MLKWYENPEVLRKYFDNQEDEDTKRIGLHLLDEVERLRRILKHLEKEGNY